MLTIINTFIMFAKLLLLAFACFIVKVGTLKCYICVFSSADIDKSCLTVTNSTQIVECTLKYCTIMRQELQDPAGVVHTFIRGCEDSPAYLNHLVTDATFKSYYRACTYDLCNSGNGIQRVTGSNLLPTGERNYTNLLVPGTGSRQLDKIFDYSLYN
ncbi:uncharacterized protein LOC123657294 [Melitaea cinxia]|uniref:uncharacterized protein LOC123657294 n=1 Tax=Melitaea cinxia TaxID=113334 RepID=UPI001E272A2D|nr:uncharacterized protein LOC123657294 [Melitaea cinxia]